MMRCATSLIRQSGQIICFTSWRGVLKPSCATMRTAGSTKARIIVAAGILPETMRRSTSHPPWRIASSFVIALRYRRRNNWPGWRLNDEGDYFVLSTRCKSTHLWCSSQVRTKSPQIPSSLTNRWRSDAGNCTVSPLVERTRTCRTVPR